MIRAPGKLTLMITAALTLFSAPSESAPKISGFEQVTETIYRGGRPENAEEMAHLSTLGIRTVINLQGQALKIFSGESVKSRAEAIGWARQSGLRYINTPFPSAKKLDARGRDTVLKAAAMLNNPDLQPVFIHGNNGSDRAGIVIAAYRILYQGCSYELARSELLDDGKVWTVLFTAPQMPFLRDIAERQQEITGALNQSCPL